MWLLVFNNIEQKGIQISEKKPQIMEMGKAEKVYRLIYTDNTLHVSLIKNRHGNPEYWQLDDTSQDYWTRVLGLTIDAEDGILIKERSNGLR